MTARLTNKFQSNLIEPIAAGSGFIKIRPEDVVRLPVLTSGDWCPLNITDPRGWEEIVHVTKIDNDGTLTVKRAAEGTRARSFQIYSRVDMRLTAESIESFLGLYYGSRTAPPDNAPLGALYLDTYRKPNVMMMLGNNGWSPVASIITAGLRQQTIIAEEGAQGPFVVDGGFSQGFVNINGLNIYPGHGLTIDATTSSFKLDEPVQKETVIVFHGYMANDAVDFFSKNEINKRFSDLTAADIAETDARKFMTADERDKLEKLKIELTAADIAETDKAKIMTADERKLLANFKDQVLDQMVDGSVIMCPFAKPAYRMVIANGALLRRKDYPLLWSVVSQLGAVSEAEWQNGQWGAYSVGDGSTTFRIPNLSGEFPRFLDTIGNVDKNRKIGSTQGDAIRNINGSMSGVSSIYKDSSDEGALKWVNKITLSRAEIGGGGGSQGIRFNASLVVPTAEENRPRNVALLPCIRY